MGPTPVYGARAEKPLQNADFAMKQTNICHLSGDIIKYIGAYSHAWRQWRASRHNSDVFIGLGALKCLAALKYLGCRSNQLYARHQADPPTTPSSVYIQP